MLPSVAPSWREQAAVTQKGRDRQAVMSLLRERMAANMLRAKRGSFQTLPASFPTVGLYPNQPLTKSRPSLKDCLVKQVHLMTTVEREKKVMSLPVCSDRLI